jgi:hypothetical protein
MDICALHEWTKSENEERYHIAMKKLNSFEMLANENANDMYSRLNILAEEVNGLRLTQISQPDCWGPSASEGPQKHDLTMFSK